MLEIIREYSFDVNFETGKFKRTDGSEERIKLVQNDNESTKFKFNFEEEIADNTNVLVRLRQFTGYVKEYTMLIQNQKAEIILTNDILSESGSLTMSITLIGTDDEILTDTEYHSKIQVIASLEGNTEIPEQEKSVLVDLISQVNSLNQTASQLVEESETALQNANTATTNANTATQNANTATSNANQAAQNANNAVTELDNRLAAKVDKVNGKDLSTNDYDNAEKEKNETNRTEILKRALITETGNKIDLEIDNQTYILTAKLYDKNNNLISTSTSIDLPLEAMVVSATYNSETKKVVLTLQSGSTTEFSIADLIDGLVNETTFNETIEELEAENIKLKQRISDLENNELINTVSGESIDIDDSANAENRGIKVIGKSWQNTTTGKNKLKLEDDTMVNYGITVTILDGKISIKGTSTDNYLWIKLTNGITMRTGTPSISNSPNWFNNNLLSGKVYTFSQIGNCDEDFFFTKNDGTRGDLIRTNETSKTVDLTETVMSDVVMYIGASGTNVDIEFYIQAVEGNDADYNYEPYTNGASPNPEYEQPIHNCSGSINFKAENKNLAWNGWAEDFAERINDSYAASIITYNNRNCLNWRAYAGYQQYDKKYMFKTNFKENTQYTFVFDIFSQFRRGNLCIEYTDGTISYPEQFTINTWNRIIFVSTYNKTVKYLRGYYAEGDSYIDLDTFMVLEGVYTAENITDYIAHEEQNITFPLQEGQVLAQDDYLADDGIHKSKGHITLTGQENWTINNISFQTKNFFPQDVALRTVNTKAFSNKYIYSYRANGISNNIDNLCFGWSATKILTIRDDDYNTTVEWETYLAEQYANGTPIIIEYELSEEAQKEAIEPYTEEQQKAWEQIKALRTYKNITHISSEDETKPTLEVTYVRDLQTVINNMQAQILS